MAKKKTFEGKGKSLKSFDPIKDIDEATDHSGLEIPNQKAKMSFVPQDGIDFEEGTFEFNSNLVESIDENGFSLTAGYNLDTKDSQQIVKDYNNCYDEAYAIVNEFYPQAQQDLQFYLGDQWSIDEKRDLSMQGRAAYVFNKCKRVVDMVSGYQRKNRLSSIVAPIENSDQKTADQFSQLLMYCMNRDGYETISDAFAGSLKTGLNFIEVWMDYRDDPIDGDIRFSRIPYNAFLLDPYFTKLDLSDCNYLMRRKYMSREQAKSILPKWSELIDEMPASCNDGKYEFMPQQRQSMKDLLGVDEYFRMNYEPAIMLVDPYSGMKQEFEGEEEQLQLILSQLPQLQVVRYQKQFIEKHIIIGKELITSIKNPNGIDMYPFVPFVSIFEPESSEWSLKWQSIIRGIKDPQKESNRRRSQMTDIIESSINSGYMAKEGSVVNPRSLFQSGQGKVTWIKDQYSLDGVRQRQAVQIPPSMFQLQQLYDQDILDIAGINQELLGAASDDDAGITVKLRQGAGLITLQTLFDRLRYSQKIVSQLVMKFIQTWSPQKVSRIINEQPTQEFYNKDFGKYDAVVQEGVLTDTQRQMFFMQLVQLKNMGEPIPPTLMLKAAPIQGKSELLEEVQQYSQQQAQQAQVQEQIAMEDRQATINHIRAETANTMASAKERETRSMANIGLAAERLSSAKEDHAQVALDRARAIKELENLDTQRLLKLVQVVKELEQKQQPQQNLMADSQLNLPLGG